SHGTVLRSHAGGAFATVDSGSTRDLHALFGTSSTDVWAAGDHVVLHFDGSAWSPSASAVIDALFALNTQWAVGENGAMYRGDAAVFTRYSSGPIDDFHGIWGTKADDVWAVHSMTLHRCGGTWVEVPSPFTGKRELFS